MAKILHYEYTSAYGSAFVKMESGDMANILMYDNVSKINVNSRTIDRQLTARQCIEQYARWKHFLMVFRRKPTLTVELCAVCRGEMKTVASEMACGHIFHRHCIIEWFQTKNQCPMCRKELFPEEIAKNCICFFKTDGKCKMYE